MSITHWYLFNYPDKINHFLVDISKVHRTLGTRRTGMTENTYYKNNEYKESLIKI